MTDFVLLFDHTSPAPPAPRGPTVLAVVDPHEETKDAVQSTANSREKNPVNIMFTRWYRAFVEETDYFLYFFLLPGSVCNDKGSSVGASCLCRTSRA